MRATLTAVIWTAATSSVVLAGVIAMTLGYMVISLDPTDMVTAGTEPWVEALRAALGFLAILLASALGLRLWHSARFRVAGAVLVAGATAAVIWAGMFMYTEYF